MKTKCSVSFEFTERPVLTWFGDVEGSAASTIIRRAVDSAQKELRPRNWSSVVAVILERDEMDAAGDTDAAEPTP